MRLALAFASLLAVFHLGDALSCFENAKVVECAGSCQNVTGFKDNERTFQSTCWPTKEISRCEETTLPDKLKLTTCYCNIDKCNGGRSMHNIALPVLILSILLYYFV